MIQVARMQNSLGSADVIWIPGGSSPKALMAARDIDLTFVFTFDQS